MTNASETDFLRFLQNFAKMDPETQAFFALLVEGIADRVKSDLEVERMPTVDLFREVIQEIAPERVADFDRYVEGQAA